MKFNLYKYLILCLVFLPLGVLAQGQVVSGTVTDADDGSGIPGVNVLIKGTTEGTITDFDGNYSLTVPEGAVLVFSFVGYVSQEVEISAQSTVDIALVSDVTQLSEVVVIGYGVQKKKVVTGAIESVSSKEINLTPVVSPEQALQGRAPGVQVLNQSGQPGDRPAIRVRGIGTDYNSEPLYLVDGIAVNSIDNINPGDIQSMEVLKDGAATAIYGARGANGVVLITTKMGSPDVYTVSYSGYYGIQNAAKKVDLLNAEEYNQLMAGAGASNLFGVPFDANEVPANNTDWQEELFTDNAPIQNHEISVTGGNDKTTFASSLSYFSQEGIIGGDKSKFERYTARLNSRTKVNKIFTWGNTISYANVKTRGVTSNGSFNGEYSSALNLDPMTPVFEDDPLVLAQPPYFPNPFLTNSAGRAYAISSNVGGEVVNPLARLEIQTQEVVKDQILGNIYAELEPVENLKLRYTAGVDLSYVGIGSYRPLFYLSSTTNNVVATSVADRRDRNEAFQNEFTGSYNYKTGDHNFNVLGGASTLIINYERLDGGGQGINTDVPDLIYLDLTVDSTQNVRGFASEVRRASVFGRVLYDYKDRVSFSASYRRDGSSNFGSNNVYGDFWAFGASWVINEEPFFPDINALSYLKLRASWGQNGNDNIRAFSYASLVDFNIAYNFANGTVQGSNPQFIENQDVKWESSEQLNFGIESGFFENKLSVTLDYYLKTTNDLLQEQIGLATIGVPLSFANVGIMENEGFEFSLEWRSKVGSDFEYTVGLNGGYNKNTMVEVANEAGFIQGASWALAGEVTRTIEGAPVTSFFGFKTDGIFQNDTEVFQHIGPEGDPIQPNAQPGDIRFVDVNNDGRITDDDRTIIGSPIPDWTVGSNISLRYKNFDLYALFTGQFGNDVFNGINRPDISTSNRQDYILNAWTETNPSNTVPRFTISDINENYTRATDMLNIENGSYVRLKNVQIGYTLPASVLDRINCKSWRFYVSAENVFTITDYSGPDPEVGSPIDFEGSGVARIRDMGIDRGIYPQARTFRLGTTVTF